MFEIFDDEVSASSLPHKTHIERMLRSKGKLRKLTLIGFEAIVEEWAELSEKLDLVGITSLELVEGSRSHSNFDWLNTFGFIEELVLNSDLIPKVSCFSRLKKLKSLSLGATRSHKTINLIDYLDVLKKLKFLALTGTFNGCSVLKECPLLDGLCLNSFSLANYRDVETLSVKNLTIYDSPNFDLSVIRSFKEMLSIEIYSPINVENIPDLSLNEKIKTVSITLTRKTWVRKEEIEKKFPSGIEVEFC